MNRSRRSGFTLPEVLVTIAIVATLAAVLLPALNSQLTKGEASRASNDVLAVQTAINTFVSDVRRYPSSLNQLTTAITTSNLDIKGLAYPSPLVARWKGPYLVKELTASSTLITGFGAEVQSTFSQSPLYNGVKYVQVNVLPIPEEEFTSLDQIIDDVANSSTGQLRYSSASSSAAFYAVPIQ